MAKRKATRKKAAISSGKKAKTSTPIRKKTKKTRTTRASRGTVNKTKTPGKSAPSRKKSVTKKSVKKKAAANKPTKKQAMKKGASKQVAATAAKVAKPSGPKKAAGKKIAKKKAVKRKFARRRDAGPQEPGLPFKEIRARLGLIRPQIAALRWLDGLYLYGAALVKEPRLERVDFIVIYRGLRGAARLKSAEAELRELIAAVLPVEFDLNTGSAGIGRLLGEGNPAAQAHLGYSEPVFTRDA